MPQGDPINAVSMNGGDSFRAVQARYPSPAVREMYYRARSILIGTRSVLGYESVFPEDREWAERVLTSLEPLPDVR